MKIQNIVLIILTIILAITVGLLGFRYFTDQNQKNSNVTTLSNAKKLTLKNQNKIYEFQVEIADDYEERLTGLMNRQSLGDREGMLFIFDDISQRSFWMKDTYIPLDMIFFDENNKFVSVQKNAQPCLNQGYSCPGYQSDGPAKYVLEVRAGVLSDAVYDEGLEFTLN
jgi:uncharacterized protein